MMPLPGPSLLYTPLFATLKKSLLLLRLSAVTRHYISRHMASIRHEYEPLMHYAMLRAPPRPEGSKG